MEASGILYINSTTIISSTGSGGVNITTGGSSIVKPTTIRSTPAFTSGAYKSRFAAMTIAGQNIILPDILLFCPKFKHYIHILPFLDNIFSMGHVS